MPLNLLLLFTAFASGSFSQNVPDSQILQKAAVAAGAGTDRNTWTCKGACKVHGADEMLELTFNGFKFYNAAIGPLNDIAGYDGKECWVENWSGIPHVSGLIEKDSNELVCWIMDGQWAAPGSPVDVKSSSETTNGIVLKVTVKGGNTDATLTLDQTTYLPKSLAYWTDSGDEKWEFTDYKQFGKRTLATDVKHTLTEQTETYHFDSVEKSRVRENLYSMPAADLSGTNYNAGPDHTIEIKRVMGYMFVHPLVDGKDLGWFFLDSGADVMCMDPKVAEEQGFKVVGNDTAAGVVAVLHLNICRANSFQLGSTSFKDPTFFEIDLSQFAAAFGLKVAGICGYDFIARNVMVVDPKGAKIALFNPAHATVPEDARFYPVVFNGETPCIPARFEGGHEGLFALDTGSSSTVDFFTPIVEQLKMLEGRELSTNQTGGAGGNSESKQGKIAYFEVGGHRFDDPYVGLQITKKGSFASPYLDGNIGMGFLGNFSRIVFDYPHGRMGFVY